MLLSMVISCLSMWSIVWWCLGLSLGLWFHGFRVDNRSFTWMAFALFHGLWYLEGIGRINHHRVIYDVMMVPTTRNRVFVRGPFCQKLVNRVSWHPWFGHRWARPRTPYWCWSVFLIVEYSIVVDVYTLI